MQEMGSFSQFLIYSTTPCKPMEKRKMILLNEENRRDRIDLQEEVQRGFDESGKLPDRLKRYAFARERALLNLPQITERINALGVFPNAYRLNLERIWPRLSECGDYLVFKDYYTVGKVRLTAANFCMVHLLCPLCAVRRGSKNLEAYTQRFEIIRTKNSGLKLSLLTLTIKNGQDPKERFNHLKKSFITMLERRRKTLAGARGWHSEFTKIVGLVGSIEITKDNGFGKVKETGWHPYANIIVLHSEWFDYAELQAEWLKITCDSHVLNVTPAQHPNDPTQDFLEVFKYALKFSDLTQAQNLEAYEAMKGKQLLFSAGLFRGVEVPEALTDEELDDLPYIELFYKYTAGSGYNITKIRESDDPNDVKKELWHKVT
jgi:hypothetical protein